MGTLSKSLLLFVMNLLDAQLTLLWIHLNVATEGNGLMARVLNHGEMPFLSVKLVVGAFAALILYRCAHLPIAKHGLTLALAIYLAVMLIHAATGCAVLGWQGPIHLMAFLGHLPRAIVTLFYEAAV